MSVETVLVFLSRLSLVLLFMPFSALDKAMNFTAATGQAGQAVGSAPLARVMVLAALSVELVMSLGVLTGVADRFAALVLAGYCALTALLWKRFWKEPDFTLVGPSEGRNVFWDFLKNFAVAGGFLLLAVGPTVRDVDAFLQAPFASSRPYASSAEAAPADAPPIDALPAGSAQGSPADPADAR